MAFARMLGGCMNNAEIYRRTMKFAIRRILCTIAGIVIVVALPLAAFFVSSMFSDEMITVVATGVALILGIVLFVLIARYASYLYTAGQVAMIARGVSSGSLPDDTFSAGKQAVKRRFATASVYFVLFGITKAISREVTAGLNAVAGAIDGAGKGPGPASSVAGIVSAVISVVLEYLNYCSLGWVFLHDDQNAFKSTCDGAVVYFQNWKVLLRNAAKVILVTFVSFLIIGGAFFALAFFAFGAIPPLAGALSDIDAQIVLDDGTAAPAGTSLAVLSIVVALLLWVGVHGAFVKPYILVSVMRRYIEAGMSTPPAVDLYGKLASISKGFRRALEKSGDAAGADLDAGANAA